MTLDPRAQLAWLSAVFLGTLFGGDPGMLAAAVLAGLVQARNGLLRRGARLLLALAPLAALLLVLESLAGRPGEGPRAAARLVVLAQVGVAFAWSANGEALAAGLRALRIPYQVVFVLVAGSRFVPSTAADLASLRDTARLRGVALDGPPWRQIGGWRRILVPLLVATVRRGLQLGEAMEARGFGAGQRRTTRHQLRWASRDTVLVLAAAVYLGALLRASR